MASSMISTLIFFIATLFVASAVGFMFVSTVDTQDDALNGQSDRFNQKIKTDFTVETVAYSNGPDIVIIYIRNSGKERINPERLDVYVNGVKVDKCNDYLVEVTPDTEIVDTEYFNPSEILRIAFASNTDLLSATSFIITDSLGNQETLNATPIASSENPSLPAEGIC